MKSAGTKISEAVTASLEQNRTDGPVKAVGCVIMASGLGRRFGGNKLLADFDGQPLISRILECSARFPCLRRLVVTRHAGIAALCREMGLFVLLHDLPDRSDTIRLSLGQLLAIEDGQDHIWPPAHSHLSGCLFCPADQPLLRPESLEALLQAFFQNPDSICRPAYEGRAASPVLLGRRFFPELLTLPRGAGGSFLAQKYPAQVVQIPVRDAFELDDVDTPQDLARLFLLSKGI